MKKWQLLTLLFIFYAGLFVIFTWPLTNNFTSSFLAVPGGDSSQYVWDAWHFRKVLLAGQNPYLTDWVFYPQGTGLVMHGYIPVLGLLNLTLNNAVLSVNTALLLSAGLSGAGAIGWPAAGYKARGYACWRALCLPILPSSYSVLPSILTSNSPPPFRFIYWSLCGLLNFRKDSSCPGFEAGMP